MTEQRAWATYWRNGDLRARAFLVSHYDYLARITANKLKWNLISREDVLCEARLGLVLAIDSFDPQKGNFKSWAIGRMRSEILEATRRLDCHTRNERETTQAIAAMSALMETETGVPPVNEAVAARMNMSMRVYLAYQRMPDRFESACWEESGLSLEDFGQRSLTMQVDGSNEDPARLVEQKLVIDEVRQAVKCLKPRTSQIVNARLFQGENLREIGDAMGLSAVRIRQIYVEALDQMQVGLAGRI